MISRRRIAVAVLACAAAAFLPGGVADAGDGFVMRESLHFIPSAGEPDAIGGIEAWLRVTNDHKLVQSFTVWFKGLSDVSDGATLWMAPEGGYSYEEVAPFAVSANGTGIWSVYLDSSWENNPELPLGVERILDLHSVRVEVRVPRDGDDEPVLAGQIFGYHYGSIPNGKGGPGTRVKRARMKQPPAPVEAPDVARGRLRVWRQKKKGDLASLDQGFEIFALDLTPDDTYEVWLEDAAGEMIYLDETDSTSEGLAYFSLDTRYDGLLPIEADVETVRDLSRRRVELRRTGFEEPSLVGLFPRIR